MVIRESVIPYKYGETIRIRPLTDLHAGNTLCDLRAAKAFIQDAPEGCYFVGLGDLMDMVIAGDVKRYQKSAVEGDGDDVVDQQIEVVEKLLDPVKDRILGLGEGNHEANITKRCGTNPMARLTKSLGVPFLGYSWLLKLKLSEDGARVRTVVIRGHHGWGGGSRTQGADLSKYARDVGYWDADIFLYGHVHRKQTDEVPRLGLAGKKLISKPKLFGICGTFLKTYSEGETASYSERAGYPPVTVGGVTLCIKPNGDWVRMWFE
jgi:predicted phosphodiesterase